MAVGAVSLMETEKGRLSRSVGSSPVPSSSSCNLLCFRVSCFERVGLIWSVFCIVWRSNHGKPIKKAAFFVMLSLSFCSTVFFFNILFFFVPVEIGDRRVELFFLFACSVGLCPALHIAGKEREARSPASKL